MSRRQFGELAVSDPLLTLTERLFGEDDGEPVSHRGGTRQYLAVVALLATIIVLRRPDAVTNPQFWAEDGTVFFYDQLLLGFPRTLETLYFGFPYVAHRLIAFFGSLVPLAEAPRVYTSCAVTLTAFGVATLQHPGFRHIVRSDVLRAAVAVATVSAPFGQEVLSNPTNVGWFIAVWLSWVSMVRLPRHGVCAAVLAMLGSAAVFATPLAVTNVPLWLLRAWYGVRRRHPGDLGFALALLTASGALVLVAGGLGAERGAGAPVDAVLAGPMLRASAGLIAWQLAALPLSPGVMARVGETGPAAVVAVTLGIVTALAGMCWLGRGRRAVAMGAVFALFVGTYLVIAIGRPRYVLFLADAGFGHLDFRYRIVPSAMFALMVGIGLDGLRSAPMRRVASAAVLTLLIWAWHAHFILPPLSDRQWRRHAAELERLLAGESTAPLTIPLNPPWMSLRFGPLDWSDEMAMHGDHAEFTSRSDGLSAIDLVGRGPQRVHGRSPRVSVVDLDVGVVVAVSDGPGALPIHDGPTGMFRFRPLGSSAGRRYRVVVDEANPSAQGSAAERRTFRYGWVRSPSRP
jgi:hypothetical protein